jgi:hypothetical protein
MHPTPMRNISSDLMIRSKAPTFGMLPWHNHPLIQKHAFGKSGMARRHCFGRLLETTTSLHSLEVLTPSTSIKCNIWLHSRWQDLWLRSLTIIPGELGKLFLKISTFQKIVICNLGVPFPPRGKIHISDGSDILRWGYSPMGMFTVKEAYFLHENFHTQPKEHIWNIIWKSKLWPKISTFLWLMVQNRILTWDNLRKRGFIGPSICHLCQQQEETMEHIFNQCPLSGESGIRLPKL